MKRAFLALALIGLLTGGAITAVADDFRFNCDGNGPCGGRGAGPLATLELNDDQQQEIEQIISQHRAEHEPLREQKRADRAAMRELLASDPVDEAALRQLARQQADRRVDRQLARQETRARIEAVLTPEQRQQLEQQRAERRARFGKGEVGRHRGGFDRGGDCNGRGGRRW